MHLDFVVSLCVIFLFFLLWLLFFPQFQPFLFRSRLQRNKKPSPGEEEHTYNSNSNVDREGDQGLLSWIHQHSRDSFGVEVQTQAPPAPPATLKKQLPMCRQSKPVRMGLGLGFIAPQALGGDQQSSLTPNIMIKSPPQVFTSAAYTTPQQKIRWTPARLPLINWGKEREETYCSFSAENVRDSLELKGRERIFERLLL